jgi:hypothetical protein
MGTASGWMVAVLLAAQPLAAQPPTVNLTLPASFDRWMYPFSTAPGTRTIGSTFGAPGNPAFDDADAQIVLGFALTDAQLPTGTDLGQYRVTAATVQLTTATDLAFPIDPTSDPRSSYDGSAADPDPGRPIELFGLGFRHGYTSAAFGTGTAGPPQFEETDAFGIPGPPAPRNRAVFISDYLDGAARDVSNFVRDQLNAQPWAVGAVESLAPGTAVPINTPVQFELDLVDPHVAAYLNGGLDAGGFFFGIASLHTAVTGSSQGIPSFYLSHPTQGSQGPVAQLILELTLVPEPASWLSLSILPMCLTFWLRRRRYSR